MASKKHGNPAELKQIVDSSNQDLEQMKLGLEKLRNLSQDDRTEAAMLRSRVDEQSHLIMMLKTRSDENLRRVQVLERMNKDLENCVETANSELKIETKRAKMLDKRFFELASNHQEMIKIKDEYKEANALLKRENERLKQENVNLFSQALCDRDQCIQKLESQTDELQKQYTALEQKLRLSLSEAEQKERELKQKLASLESGSNSQKESLQRQVSKAEERLKDAISRLEKERTQQTEADQRYKDLSREKDDLLDLAMHRGKLIQEKQVENKSLLRGIDDLKANIRSLEEKFEKDAVLVDANKAVVRLREELDKAERRYKQVLTEYEAYKTHTNRLLEQERKLNEKLRHLAG